PAALDQHADLRGVVVGRDQVAFGTIIEAVAVGADVVANGPGVERHAAQISGDADAVLVGADVVALHLVGGGAGAADGDAIVGVPADDVAGARGGAADHVPGRASLDQYAPRCVAQAAGAGGVEAEVVAGHDVTRCGGAGDLHTVGVV